MLFEFSVPVVIDQVFLDSIGADSDISVWIGTKTDPFNNHITLSDAVLTSLGAREDNNMTGTVASRWANINSAGVSGNVLVIASLVSDISPEDEFKLSKLDISCRSIQAGFPGVIAKVITSTTFASCWRYSIAFVGLPLRL